MDYNTIEQKVKDFILNELEIAKRHKGDTKMILNGRAIAFGALQFATNNLFPCYNTDLAEWWEKEIWEKFTNLAEGIEE